MQSIAILNPTSSAIHYGIEGKKMGLHTIAVMTQESWPARLERFMNNESFDETVYVADAAGAVHELRDRSVVALLPGSPFGVDVIDSIACSLGLPHNCRETASARSDKWLMKTRLVEQGVPCHAFQVVRDMESPASLAFDFPVVAKPREGTGGLQVHVCADWHQMRAAIHSIENLDPLFVGKDRSVLIEEFVEGEEYCMTTANLGDGRRTLLSLARYERTARQGRCTVYRNIWSMPVDSERALRWFEYGEDVNRALGVELGINDIEFKAPRGQPRLIELNNRLPGAKLPVLIQHCTGVNCYAENIKIFRGEKDLMTKSPQYEKHFCVCCLINDSERVLTGITGLNEVRQLDSFVGFDLVVPIGELAPATVDFDTAWGFVYLANADADTLQSDVEFAHSNLTF